MVSSIDDRKRPIHATTYLHRESIAPRTTPAPTPAPETHYRREGEARAPTLPARGVGSPDGTMRAGELARVDETLRRTRTLATATPATPLGVGGEVALTGPLGRAGGAVVRRLGDMGGYVTRNVTGSPDDAANVRRGADVVAHFIDPQAPTGPSAPDAGAAARRADGVPERLDRHDYGPPANPTGPGDIATDLDPATGQPRTGTLYNVRTDDGHDYAVRNALPRGLTRAQAEAIFNRYNAPTTEALYGDGNDPGLTGGTVDMRASNGNDPDSRQRTAVMGLLNLDDMGGEVEMNRGRTRDGRVWAINSTIRDRHPLAGHITRTLEFHDGQYYIHTRGVGRGDDSNFGLRHVANGWVGPPAFNNLDAAAIRAGERVLRGEPLDVPPATTLGERVWAGVDRLSRGEFLELFDPLTG